MVHVGIYVELNVKTSVRLGVTIHVIVVANIHVTELHMEFHKMAVLVIATVAVLIVAVDVKILVVADVKRLVVADVNQLVQVDVKDHARLAAIICVQPVAKGHAILGVKVHVNQDVILHANLDAKVLALEAVQRGVVEIVQILVHSPVVM